MTTRTDSDQTPDVTAKKLNAVEPSRQFYWACVLLVEDNDDLRSLLKTLLKQRGNINVVEADNGEMAVALAKNVRLDLILMDGTLPLLDGFEATRRIRESRSSASAHQVPIIFLSGHAQPAVKAQAFAAGCTDYLIKPFDSGELDQVLERYILPSE